MWLHLYLNPVTNLITASLAVKKMLEKWVQAGFELVCTFDILYSSVMGSADIMTAIVSYLFID